MQPRNEPGPSALRSMQRCHSISRSGMESEARVRVKQGVVVGREELLPNGKPYQYFLGIPYALPPVGELRFQAPIPLKTFAKPEIECTKEGNVCPQREPLSREILGSEDCLYLNVYSPKNKSSAPLPVMVFLHYGAFMYGSGNKSMFAPLYLLQEDVIVVTLNYRLGALGLLSLPEANIPGNMTLKDQHLALQWVNENISEFNGNPNNVTLFGESAGSVCAHLHLLSERSKGLFHKVILQSGTANMGWATSENLSTLTMNLANLLGCESNDSQEVAIFLKTYPNVYDFIKCAPKLLKRQQKSFAIPFAPGVERDSEDAIFKEAPLKSMSKYNHVDIPVMMGYNSAEGIVAVGSAAKNLSGIEKDLDGFVRQKLNLQENDPKFLKVTQKIRDFYFKGGVVDEQNLNPLADLYGDMHFIIDCNFAAELHSRKQPNSPLYFYRFDYVGGLNIYKQLSGFSNLKGVNHADEIFYIFQCESAKEPWDEKDKKMVKTMCKLWTNFAKHGNPTPDKNDAFVDCTWEAVRKVGENEKFTLNAFIIDEKQKMLNNPDADRMDFWREIYRDFNTNASKM